MYRKHGAVVRWLVPTLIATGISLVGWAALNLTPKYEKWLWLAMVGVVLELPGEILATFLAAIFSPQGFHGIDDFAWVILPFNLFFYLLAFFLLFRRGSRKTIQSEINRQNS